jgi:uncharacterized membrane protein YgcG
MSFAIWTGIAIVFSIICFKLMQRAEMRKGVAARNSNGDSSLGSSGGDWGWSFFSSDSGHGSSGDNCSASDSSSSGSCDSGGGGDGGGGGSGD